MALIQVGTIAYRNLETGEFGPSMPICKEIPETQEQVDEYISHEFARAFAKNIGQYINKTRNN